MATQTIEFDTPYTVTVNNVVARFGDDIFTRTDGVITRTSDFGGFIIDLKSSDNKVEFNESINFWNTKNDTGEIIPIREKFSDFADNPLTGKLKGKNDTYLQYEIIYDAVADNIILTYELHSILLPSYLDISSRQEQYTNIAITNGEVTSNLKIKIEPYIGANRVRIGTPGLVPYATPNERNMFLKGNGVWDVPEGVKDINVTLDKEIINEQKNVKIDNTLSILDYELIMHTSQDDYINIIFADNDLNFTKKDYDGPGPVSKVDEMRSNFNYSTIFSIDDISEYDGFEFNMTLYPEDEEYIQDYISNSTTQLYYDIGWSNTHLFLSDSSFITEKYTTYFSTDGGASSIDVFPKHFIDISELPSNNETKTFHFTHSSYTTMGSAVSSHWADRHLDFQNIDINITNLGNNTYKFELCWNTTDEITESTEIAKINHNIIKNDDTNSTDTVSIFFKNSTETITEEKTNLDISVELELDIIGG